MDYEKFIRACLGNPSNEQIMEGAKAAVAQLKAKFGDEAVNSLAKEIFGITASLATPKAQNTTPTYSNGGTWNKRDSSGRFCR